MKTSLIIFTLLIPVALIAQRVPLGMFAQKIKVETTKPLLSLRAKLVDKTTGKPSAGTLAYVTVPGPVFEMRTARSDNAGMVTFLLKSPDAPGQLIFQTNNLTDSNIVFELAEPLAQTLETERYPTKIREVGDTLPFFGKGDREYLLDDYVRFPTMEEVMREFVQEVRVRKVRNRFQLEVMNEPHLIYFDTEPLVLLDGIPVFDTNVLMTIDPLKIRSIQVVSRKYYYGSSVLSGIVSFSSYNGDLAGYQLPHQALVRDFNAGTSVK